MTLTFEKTIEPRERAPGSTEYLAEFDKKSFDPKQPKPGWHRTHQFNKYSNVARFVH